MAAGRELRLVMVGHVDHGKSTILGRLLADGGGLPEGRLDAIQELCRRTSRPFEPAFLLDALKEERAQGVTIDAARCFFQTGGRRYLLIDAPGHIEFLKNMVTGAASADAALLVIDAREGVMENSRRHGYLLSMLGIREFAVLVNKMDLVDYSEAVYGRIVAEYSRFLNRIGLEQKSAGPDGSWAGGSVAFIPVSGLTGENLVRRSGEMPWYRGPILLERMEAFAGEPLPEQRPLRLPVQDVYKFTRGGDNRRIVVGRMESGHLAAGDTITFYPSGKQAVVRTLEAWNQSPAPEKGGAGWSVGCTLEKQIFIRRGDLAAPSGGAEGAVPRVAREIHTRLFWLGHEPLRPGKKYGFKIHTARAEMEIAAIARVLDAATLVPKSAGQVERNEVAECTLRLDRAVAFDLAAEFPATGRFVITDEYEIAGGGMITGYEETAPDALSARIRQRNLHWEAAAISGEERARRYRQMPCLILISGPAADPARKRIAKELEARLFAEGNFVYFIGMASLVYGLDADLRNGSHRPAGDCPDPGEISEEHFRRLGEIANLMLDAGLILIVSAREARQQDIEVLAAVLNRPADRLLTIWAGDPVTTDFLPDLHLTAPECPEGAGHIQTILARQGILQAST